jgi:hypothetical protein
MIEATKMLLNSAGVSVGVVDKGDFGKLCVHSWSVLVDGANLPGPDWVARE